MIELKKRTWLSFLWYWVTINAPLIYRLGRKSKRSHLYCLYGCWLHFRMSWSMHAFMKSQHVSEDQK